MTFSSFNMGEFSFLKHWFLKYFFNYGFIPKSVARIELSPVHDTARRLPIHSLTWPSRIRRHLSCCRVHTTHAGNTHLNYCHGNIANQINILNSALYVQIYVRYRNSVSYNCKGRVHFNMKLAKDFIRSKIHATLWMH